MTIGKKLTISARKRDKKASSKYTKRLEQEKAEDPERKLYKSLREKLNKARTERDECRSDLDKINETIDSCI